MIYIDISGSMALILKSFNKAFLTPNKCLSLHTCAHIYELPYFISTMLESMKNISKCDRKIDKLTIRQIKRQKDEQLDKIKRIYTL